MKLTLGFSPCPNDTFIFDALVNHKIDTAGLEFEVILDDVQSLNQGAMENRLDISKISYGVLPLLLDHYIVLQAGGALGKGVGPLLVTGLPQLPAAEGIQQLRIAIPGINTTAHLLFSLAYPQAMKKDFMVFSAIEGAVVSGKSDCGVIIHENRFTYQQKGLKKIVDLGEYWEQKTQSPIPLGGIVMRKSMDPALQKKVDLLIRESVEFAFSNYPSITDYVKMHSQEMEESVMRQHINLYVNDFSINLGTEGRKAVHTLLEVYQSLHPEQQFAHHEIFRK